MGNQINCNSCGYNINQELHIQLIRNNVIVNTQEPRISMGKETKNNRVSKFKKYSKKKTSLSRNVMVKTLSELTNHTSNPSINIIKFKYNNYIYIGCSSQSREIINGFGIAYNDFARYVGEFDSNLAKGIGRFENENEDKIFIGEFDNNKANGYGQLITSSKTEFEGYWKNDSQYCEGTETWIDGSKYKGCYVNGIKSGIGTYKWPDGSWYQGEWMNEEIHGWGIYSFNDGRIYKGNWSHNQMNGYGEYIFDDGKLHCLFNQAVTTTGRLSSSEPNLQNISIRDEEAKSIRKAFYYKENNISIMSYDYSQIELRLLANFSHCQKLIDTFNSGKDIHAETARNVFHINEVEVPSPLRRKAKAVNFGIVYGISNWGLSKQINVSAKEADQIIQNFYDAYPEVASFLQQTIYDVQDNGFVKTMFGRKRYIREIFDSNYSVREFAKRAAMNAPIQGTAADLIKIAMIDVAKEIKNNNLKSKLVLQIHDELIFKVYDDEVDKLTNIVKNCMENAINLDVKLEVDGGVAKTWYDAK